MNKLAAGALALALGLGAVAPAVAAEHTGAELVLERYEKELTAANKAYKAYLDAEEKLNVAKKELDEAEAERLAAEKAYNALFPSVGHVYDENGKIIEVATLELRPVEEAAAALNLISTSATFSAKVDVEHYQASSKAEVEAAIRAYAKNDAGVRPEQFEAAISNYVDRVHEYNVQLKSRASKVQAYQNLKAAEAKKTAKNTAYKEAKAAYDKALSAYETALATLKNRAEQYGLVVQVGANGVQIVKPEDSKVKPAPGKRSKEELVKELKKAADDNRAAIKSAEFLLENAPKSVAKVKGKLEDQIVTAKAALAKAEAALEKLEGKKMALVATAYADEDVSVDELESLIKENEDAANAINETIKENEKEQPEVEEEKPEEKPEEKEEDKKEEKKPAKKAGNNARTGIAGVAGVAGILAAASVAYAASKRD